MTAREVAARYANALEGEEGEGGFLAQFRQTRKVAQELGAFWEEVHTGGWGEALKSRGLENVAKAAPEAAALALAAHLSGPAGSLEAVAARAALAEVLREALAARIVGEEVPGPAQAVRGFLARAVSVRLVLDLGESLEATAGAPRQLAEALAGLRQAIDQAAGLAAGQPRDWAGLSGWQWTTQILQDLQETLSRRARPENAGGSHGGA